MIDETDQTTQTAEPTPAMPPAAEPPPSDLSAVSAEPVPPLGDANAPAAAEPGPVATTGAPEEVASSEVADEDAAAVSADDDTGPDDDADEDADDGIDASYSDEREDVQPLEFVDESVVEDIKTDWYILKVQVNREESIGDALTRRVKVAGLERYFTDIIVPTESVREFNKSGKQRTVKKKLYPGYIMVNMALNDDTWFLVRETSGIGDFTGRAGKPTPMDPKDVKRILDATRVDDSAGGPVKTTISFKHGDRVRVKEGYFQNFEGEVDVIDEANGRVTVMINIFGRSTPVELEHWQIEAL